MGNRRGRPQSPAGVPAGPVLPTGWEWGGEVPAAQPVTAAGRGPRDEPPGVWSRGWRVSGSGRHQVAISSGSGGGSRQPPASGLPCPGVRLFSS